MKTSTFILTIILLTSCFDSKKPIQEKSKIELELVDEIYIKKQLYGTDSILLNKVQTELFIEEWNNAESEGPYKMGPEFWIILNLKNDSTRRFKSNNNLIQDKNGWTYSLSDSSLISSFFQSDYSFARPENYDPISFLTAVSSPLTTKKDTFRIPMTMTGNFPKSWIKDEHIDYLIKLLESKEVCGCFLNPLSSNIPTDDFAEKGGYAGIFVKAFKENKKVDLGLYSCPKVDEKLNAELLKWRQESN